MSQFLRDFLPTLQYLNMFDIFIIMALLLIARVERKPGPSSISSSSSHFQRRVLMKQYLKKFSIVHYNVQSIANKIDLIESEFSTFDIICITETWLDRKTTDDILNIQGF